MWKKKIPVLEEQNFWIPILFCSRRRIWFLSRDIFVFSFSSRIVFEMNGKRTKNNPKEPQKKMKELKRTKKSEEMDQKWKRTEKKT